MGAQAITHDAGYYIGLGVQAVAVLVLLGLVVAGIAIAVRAKTASGRGCGIVMAVAFALQSGLVALWFLINIVAGLPSTTNNTRTVQANDGSCEISIPVFWINSPELSKEAVLGAKAPGDSEYVVVFVDSKQDYTGSLADYAHDSANHMRAKLISPQTELPAAITINGRSAIRQIVHGEIDRLRITYVITYFESRNRFFRVFCWSLESKAAAVRNDFDKIAESFHETTPENSDDS